MLSLFSFGKKLRSTRKKSKVHRKPPARLLKCCKRYGVRTTKKVGSKRVYKKISLLKKACLKKAMALKKKLMKKKKNVSKKHHRRSHHRRSYFGKNAVQCSVVSNQLKNAQHSLDNLKATQAKACAPAPPPVVHSSPHYSPVHSSPAHMFGKAKKVSKKAAMKAFRSFYKRHCAGRRAGFGNGGNPPLNASMGYEFCPDGTGGVLGANSTGLFPSPCVTATKFGRRRRRCMSVGPVKRRKSAIGRRRRRCMSVGTVKARKSAVGSIKRRRSAVGTIKRRKSAVGTVKGRKSAVGSIKRRKSAVGTVKRRRRRSEV